MSRRPDTRPGEGPPPDEALVAEYVLGLLDPTEAGLLEARMAREPRLGRLHAEWEAWFAPLMGDEPVDPPARLRQRIEARLFPTRRGSFGLRALLGGASGLLAGGVAAVILSVVVPLAPAFTPTLSAEVAATEAGGAIAVSAAADPERSILRIAVEGRDPAPGRVFQLWGIAGAEAPVSLGLIGEDGTLVVAEPAVALAEGLVIAVSDEPEGGSPEPVPTGPVLAAGPLEPVG